MKYSLGLDFGTLSGKALLIDTTEGGVVATAEKPYTHGVIESALPTGKKLMPDWALQDPDDYLEALEETVTAVINESGVSPEDIVGVGIDFTACTVMPVASDGDVLCMKPEWKDNPHAYAKLWKHHSAQRQADKLNKIAMMNGERWLERYGGRINSEWEIPKLMQVVEEAPEVYIAMAHWMEGTDWIVYKLTGQLMRSNCAATYKAMWHKKEGYPDNSFFNSLDTRLNNVIEDKYYQPIRNIGECAGYITEAMAKKTGLKAGTPVAVGNVDAHVAVPAAGLNQSGDVLMIMGNSTCDIMLSYAEKSVPGVCGYAEDGVLPGFVAYEAGQSCVGELFNWYVENITPREYYEEAEQRGIDIHALLTEKAAKLKPGESGLLALDWWNGNRSVLVDSDLTGLILGLTLQTKPEEIYRALIEATAFGAKVIIENFNKYNVPAIRLFASGSIAQNNPFLMQIYADVLGYDINIVSPTQTAAMGSAMYGAVAAGAKNGGFDSIYDAISKISHISDKPYMPINYNKIVYAKLYQEYEMLHDYFGRGGNTVMSRLKALRAQAKRQEGN